MQVIIGKVLIFSPNLQRKVPPSLFPAQWLSFNQKQTAKQRSGCIELTVLAVSQKVHYGKTSSALSLTTSPFLCLTKVTACLDVLPLDTDGCISKRPCEGQSGCFSVLHDILKSYSMYYYTFYYILFGQLVHKKAMYFTLLF